MERRTIVIFTSHLSIGGAEKIIVKQCEILRNHGWDVTVVCTDHFGRFGEYLRLMDFEIVDLSRVEKQRSKTHIATTVLNKKKPSVILLSNVQIEEVIKRTKKALRYKVVMQVNGCLALKDSPANRIIRHYRHLIDAIIIPHPKSLDIAAKRYPDTQKVLLANPIDSEFFSYPIPDIKNNIIGYCGRIAEEKSLVSFAKVCGIVKREIPDLEALIVGDAEEDYFQCLKYKEKIIETFEQEDVPYTITGYKLFCPPFMSQMKVLVHLSVTEGYGNVVWEGLALGIPVVSLNVGASYLCLRAGQPTGSLLDWQWNGKDYELPEAKIQEVALSVVSLLRSGLSGPLEIRQVAEECKEDVYAAKFVEFIETTQK